MTNDMRKANKPTRSGSKEGIFQRIQILICDDDTAFMESFRTRVEAYMQEQNVKTKIITATGRESVGKTVLAGCDMAFLDIDLLQDRLSGMDIARQLRSLRDDAVILFVTNFPEYAPEGYEVNAFRYLLKKDLDAKLETYLADAIAHVRKFCKILKIRTEGEQMDLPIRDILYFEANGHTAIAYLRKVGEEKGERQYDFYTSFAELEAFLEEKGFLRVHKSYLVNMNYIKKLLCHEVTLTTGQTLPVSPRDYALKKQKYLLWKGR